MGWFSKSPESGAPTAPPSASPPLPADHVLLTTLPTAPPSSVSSPSTEPVKPSEPVAGAASSPPENTRPATVVDAVRTIRPADFTAFHMMPCARESLLTGLGAGFGIGGIRLVFGGTRSFVPKVIRIRKPPTEANGFFWCKTGNAWTSMSYFVGSFALGSLGMHTFCRQRRQLELAAVARATEIMQRKREERKAQAEEKRREMAERRERRERHEREKTGWMRWRGGSSES